jgi:hypothetical protein
VAFIFASWLFLNKLHSEPRTVADFWDERNATVSSKPILSRPATNPWHRVALSLTFFLGLIPAALNAFQQAHPHQNLPHISYTADTQNARALIFMNNPEFLWASNNVCDLADDSHPFGRASCRTSLFRIDDLQQGKYRAWWEHRNMMPFAIRSGLLISNPGSKTAIVEILGLALEANSTRRGGNEFVELFNEARAPKLLSLKPGEKVMLDELSQKWIHPSHFFAGVADFNVVEGSISLDEIVFRKQPAHTLTAVGYSQRSLWGVHESLVYKGIAPNAAVVLQGAEFSLDDTTPTGSMPLSYRLSQPQGADHTHGFCSPELSPPCAGNALVRDAEPTPQHSWVSHIAPDPRDPNPKRKRAILDDLVELVVPSSTPNCPSLWPMQKNLAERSCMRMSAHFHWFLEDFNHWRLPNWGNWAVQYRHPIRIANSGTRDRTVVLKVTADGASPLAYRGTGVSTAWQQVFLDPRSKNANHASVVIAKSKISAGTTLDMQGEFILSGPGAGTLEHQIEIID